MDISEQEILKEIIEFYIENCEKYMQNTQVDYEKSVLQRKIDNAKTLKYKYCKV